MRTIKYAALNMSVLVLGLALLAFAGAGIEGMMAWQASMGICALLVLAVRACWHEICHMDRAARHARRMRYARRNAAVCAASAHREVPDLRVA